MAENETQYLDKQGRYPWEFWLVICMLVALLILVLVLLWRDIPGPDVSVMPVKEGGREITFQNLLDYNNRMLENRKDILSLIITAFGAWVGAGAAYFFGRENLRVASEGLLAMRQISPRERLSQTSIKQIPPTTIDWTVDKDTLVADVRKKLEDEPSRWFIPIIKKDDGSLDTVVNEEAVWRFLLAPEGQEPVTVASSPPTARPAPPTKKISDLLTYIDSKPDLRRFRDIHIAVPMETTVGAANDLMESKRVFLAIVVSEGKPTHFFTTSEVRKVLLQGS